MQDVYLSMCVWFFDHGCLMSNAFKIFFQELTNENYVCLNNCNQKITIGKQFVVKSNELTNPTRNWFFFPNYNLGNYIHCMKCTLD